MSICPSRLTQGRMRLRHFLPPVLSFLSFACATSAPVPNQDGDAQVVLRRIEVVSADYMKMDLWVVFSIDNADSVDIEVDASVDAAIAGEAKGDGGEGSDEQAATQSGAQPTSGILLGERVHGSARGKAAAFNRSELRVPVTLPLPSDVQVLQQVVGWKKMWIDVQGELRVGNKTIPVKGAREVAPPQLPIPVLKEAQVASGDKGVDGAGFFKVLLDNRNPFPVQVDQFYWSIRIEGKELRAAGSGEGADTIPASAAIEYESTVEMNSTAFGKELKAILTKPAVAYVVEGVYEVSGIRKEFRFAGDMKLPR